jgi:hypothetical protein
MELVNDQGFIIVKHRPKDGLCATCTHDASLCTGTKFLAMPIISIDADDTLVVECTDHEKRKDEIVV